MGDHGYCDVRDAPCLYSASDSMCCFSIKIHSRHYVTGGDANFPEYKVKAFQVIPQNPEFIRFIRSGLA